ncbi:c-type cytochrome [Blattabacterium cuenoti]|uniref:c-type cytochrome n=1 Tax=Blattabacterium cuenoti TaxID=1653831 RepID=UPI00163B68DF|nr:c-type cytochrome [Blattabacterium cuenoti]
MKKLSLLFFLFHFLITVLTSIKTENISGNSENGKSLFKKNCTSCHSIDLEKKMIGPALSKVTEKRSKEWLHKWIKDNKSLRKSGDKDALAIYKEYGNIEMNAFPQFSDQEIDDILSFIKNPPKKIQKTINKEEIINDDEIKEEKKFLIKLILFFIGILFIFLLWTFYRIQVLIYLINNKKYIPSFKKWDFLSHWFYKKFLTKNKYTWYLISSFLGIILLINIYIFWYFLMKIDVNNEYQPEQPIYFSHKIHSGINKIDCQYCHSSAKYGKVSGIPSVNVCMNCHMTINEYQGNYIEKGKSREEYNEEIKKIYYASGWNPEKRTYSRKSHPIKWIKIHNMPDFVYFNHSQHIINGNKTIREFKKTEIICNACHGEVQNMDQVKMSGDFTMEWCISCHKNTEINKNSKYYKEYFLKNRPFKRKEKITIDKIGGKECAKCHY